MVEFSLGGSTLRNRKVQNANNNHHLQAGHQAQHGGVRHLGIDIGKNGTLMGGKTKNGETKGKNDNSRFTLLIASGICWHVREVRCCPSQLVF